MRRTAAAIILIFGIIFSVAAQVSGPVDLVVLLDTSASMSDYYQETSSYLTGPFLREFLRIGDTFHLIAFSRTPKLEISRRIEGVGDVETIIGRMLLMYPLDPDTDITGALSFVEQYAASLPSNRQKKIILVSDGDGAIEAVQTALANISSRLQGADFQFIRVPVSGQPSSGRPATQGQIAQTPPTQIQTQTPPPQTGQTAQTQPPQQQAQTPPPQTGQITQTQPPQQQTQTPPPQTSQTAQTQQQTQPSGPVLIDELTSVLPHITDTISPSTTTSTTTEPPPSVTVTPPDTTQQTTETPTTTETPSTTQTTVTEPRATQPTTDTRPTTTAQPTQTRTSSSVTGMGIPIWLLILLILLGLLILGLIIFFSSRKLHSSPKRTVAAAASPSQRDRAGSGTDRQKSTSTSSSYAQNQKKSSSSLGTAPVAPPPARKPLPKDTPEDVNHFESGSSPMLSLFVEDQNTAIGRRNIHMAKEGSSFTVGGGKSDFLIFLVPVPPQIAEVRFDGRQCTFIPRKPQYFPDIGSQQIPYCIGKNIRVISDKDYELFIRIDRYEDPLKSLNKLLNSVSVPGL